MKKKTPRNRPNQKQKRNSSHTCTGHRYNTGLDGVMRPKRNTYQEAIDDLVEN